RVLTFLALDIYPTSALSRALAFALTDLHRAPVAAGFNRFDAGNCPVGEKFQQHRPRHRRAQTQMCGPRFLSLLWVFRAAAVSRNQQRSPESVRARHTNRPST